MSWVMGKKIKYFLVKSQGKAKFYITGLDIALLQHSGAHVKIIKRVTKQEYESGNKL